MDIRKLGITQESLRKSEQVPNMVQFIRDGGVFNSRSIANYLKVEPHKELPLEIAEFPDGARYIHNGHHRAAALFIAERFFLEADEYYVKKWDYADYADIVFLNPDGTWRGYVTPFDIRTEVRVSDLGPFKNRVKQIYDVSGSTAAMQYIRYYPDFYKKSKRLHTVEELVADDLFGARCGSPYFLEDRTF